MSSIDDVIMLREHLMHNFIPPIPQAAECAREAIDAVNSGDYEKEIELPSGKVMQAGEIVDELKLDYFIDPEHYCWE